MGARNDRYPTASQGVLARTAATMRGPGRKKMRRGPLIAHMQKHGWVFWLGKHGDEGRSIRLTDVARIAHADWCRRDELWCRRVW